MHRFEGQGNNTFVTLPSFFGVGGDCWFPGVGDLDGDGLPETVFSDNNHRVSGYPTRGSVYVYEDETLVFSAPDAQVQTSTIGDTDGDGLGEIIGRPDQYTNDHLKILESTGSGNGFALEADMPGSAYRAGSLIDADRDGVSEFWRGSGFDRGNDDCDDD